MGVRKGKKEFIPIVEISTNINNAVQSAAIQLGHEIREAYKSSVAEFYSNWSPSSYNRTESLYDAVMGVDGTVGSFYKRGRFAKQIGRINTTQVRFSGRATAHQQSVYMAGIYVSELFMPGDPYQKNPLHGQPFSKNDIFDRAFERGIHGFHQGEVAMHNKKLGKKDKRWHPGTIPRNSKPIEKIMDRRFKSIQKQSHIRQLLLDALG